MQLKPAGYLRAFFIYVEKSQNKAESAACKI